jgi:hypothetical protein
MQRPHQLVLVVVYAGIDSARSTDGTAERLDGDMNIFAMGDSYISGEGVRAFHQLVRREAAASTQRHQ